MDLTRETIEKIQELSAPNIQKIDGETWSDKGLHRVKHTPMPNTCPVNTLTGLIGYIDYVDPDEADKGFILISDPTEVIWYSNHNSELQRVKLCVANFIQPEHNFGTDITQEQFIIWLQTRFIQTEALKKLLKTVGNVQNEDIKTEVDDGVSQSVTAKVAVARMDEVKIENPIRLQPIRIFSEVKQPESPFILRLKRTMNGVLFALHEADGGMWRSEAVSRLNAFLSDEMDIPVIG